MGLTISPDSYFVGYWLPLFVSVVMLTRINCFQVYSDKLCFLTGGKEAFDGKSQGGIGPFEVQPFSQYS